MYNKLLAEYFGKCAQIYYKKGEKILHPNEFSGHVYFVEKGLIRLYRVFQSGHEVTLNTFDPTYKIPTILGLTDILIDYYVEALTEVCIRRSPRSEFLEFVHADSSVSDYLDTYKAHMFTETVRQLEWLSIPDSYTRLKAVMNSLARRVGVNKEGKIQLDNSSNLDTKITHQLLATLAGLTRETVTIQINRLIEEGYISRKDNTFVIEKLEALEAESR